MRPSSNRSQIKKDALGWGFLLPSLVFLASFTLYPIFKSIINSFQKVNLGKQTYKFIGLTNYVKVFGDKTFHIVLRNTFLFALMVIPLSMVIGFFLACLVKKERRGVGFARALIPSTRATYVAFAICSVSTHWNNFLWPMIVINSVDKRPLTVGLSLFAKASESGPMWAKVSAATLIVMLPLYILFCCFQRVFVASLVRSGIK